MNIKSIPKEKRAQLTVRRAQSEAQAAAREAAKAALYLTEGYSNRRRALAQAAQESAQQAAHNAQAAADALMRGDYDVAIAAGDPNYNILAQAREFARLAAIDEAELGRCPHCMFRIEQFTGVINLLPSLPDGTRRFEKRYTCMTCRTLWREVYTAEGVLLERTPQ